LSFTNLAYHLARFLSPSISRRATVISRCSNYPAFTSLANHLTKIISARRAATGIVCRTRYALSHSQVRSLSTLFAHCSANAVHAPFLTSEPKQWRFSSRQSWSSEGFPYAALFTRGKHCSSEEKSLWPEEKDVCPCSTSFPRRFITFKQASLATNLMTRRCRVFVSPILRLLFLKGYAELFRSAAHLLLSNQVSLFLPVKAASIDFSWAAIISWGS
jgi:hypothetical protein